MKCSPKMMEYTGHLHIVASVLGTVMGAAGFGLLAYETYKKSKE